MPRTSKAKPKPEGKTLAAAQKLANYPVLLIKTIFIVLLLAFASLATQLALHPLYESIPASLNHSKIKLLGCLLSVLLPSDSERPLERPVLLGLASWLGYAPYASYALAKWTTRWGNPELGPAVSEAIVLVPVVSVSVALVRRWNSRFLTFAPGPLSLKVAVAISTFNCLNVLESWLWSSVPLGGAVHSSNIFLAIAVGLTLCAGFAGSASSFPPKSKPTSRPYKPVIPFILPVLTSFLTLSLPPISSPRFPYSRSTPSSSISSTPPATVRILARTHSVTGLILVGEHVEEGFRFMRADHSLLGGRWVGKKAVTEAKDGLGDTIYATFVLQEAARLVKREKTQIKDERALFIGLGVGIAAQAFIAHDINTTIVEIDPAVYTYAREYFGLPQPNHVYLEDARKWLYRHAHSRPSDKFDFVVHDCFSGGGVSTHIFTLEFWEQLKGMVKSDGVVAINFAGKMGSDAARAIFLTLRKSFGRCRMFHDHLEAKFDESYYFFNIVYFCSPSSSAPPPTFRLAREADYLGSPLRRHVLGALSQREIDPSRILGDVAYVSKPDLRVKGEDRWILRDRANRLNEWQQPSALEHWSVMREVLADIFWETY